MRKEPIMRYWMDNTAANAYEVKADNGNEVRTLATLTRQRDSIGLLYTVTEGYCAGMQDYNRSSLTLAIRQAYAGELKSKRFKMKCTKPGVYEYIDQFGNEWMVEKWAANCWIVFVNNSLHYSASCPTKKGAIDYIVGKIDGFKTAA
jgi:hypothetical protein